MSASSSGSQLPRQAHPAPNNPNTQPVMFNSKNSASLKTEVSKLARLSNVQGGLPPIMRGLPALAILAGEAAARTTGGNKVEELILGTGESILLGDAPKQPPMWSGDAARPGVKMMCRICAEGHAKHGHFIQVPERGPWSPGDEEGWLSPFRSFRRDSLRFAR